MDNVLGMDFEEETIETEEVAQETDTTEETADDNGSEKTLTQAEVDEVVKERLARERKKYADYDDLKAQAEHLKNMSAVLKEAGLDGSTGDQIKALREYYGLPAETVDTPTDKGEDDTKAFVNAERFARRATTEEITEEVERILDIPPSKRNATDRAKLEALGEKYGAIKFKREYDEAAEWYEKNHDTDMGAILQSDEFKEFADGSNLPLKGILQKYMKFTGKVKQPSSPGSAKDTGGTVAKEYYTPAEVDRLTDKQLEDPKIWNAVRKSMTKWK